MVGQAPPLEEHPADAEVDLHVEDVGAPEEAPREEDGGDGAPSGRGPLVVIIAMSGTRTHREDHLRPGRHSPRPGPMRRLRSWMSEREVRVKPPRPMPRTERQQKPPVALQEMLLRKRRPLKRRLGELHRLLNSRQGSLNATMSHTSERPETHCM